jgi:hypothetical protein
MQSAHFIHILYNIQFLTSGLYNFKLFLDYSQNLDQGRIEKMRRQIIN